MKSKTYRMQVRSGDAFLVPGDMHYPLHDKAAVSAMVEWWSNRQDPYIRTGVIFQGDNLDCFGLSRFGKRAKKFWDVGRLKRGVDEFRPIATWGAKHELGALMNLGNHEYWCTQFVDANPALEGCPGVEFGALTGLNDVEGLEILDYDSRILLGDKVVVCHGHGLGARTLGGIVTKYPDQFSLIGHYHSIQYLSRTVYGPDGEPQIRGAATCGMLASYEAVEDYAPDPNMQQGFAVVEFFGDRGNGQPFFRVDQHIIVKDIKGRAYVA